MLYCNCIHAHQHGAAGITGSHFALPSEASVARCLVVAAMSLVLLPCLFCTLVSIMFPLPGPHLPPPPAFLCTLPVPCRCGCCGARG